MQRNLKCATRTVTGLFESNGSEVMLRILKKQKTKEKNKQKEKLRNCPIKAARGKKGEEKGDRPRGRSVIPAQEHRRYCSRS